MGSTVQAALQRTACNAGGRTSYYLDANGRDSTMWPWPAVRMMRRIRSFDPAGHVIAPAATQ